MSDAAEQLIAAGMSAAEAAQKSELFARCNQGVDEEPALRWFVPGRIEVLGKHTDYAGGRSLLCAAERGMCVVANPRSDSLVRVADAVSGESVEIPLGPETPTNVQRWPRYVAAVAQRIARNFPGAGYGANIVFASDLPRAAGMSSSSVLLTAIFTALSSVNYLEQRLEFRANIQSDENLAEYLGCIENGQTYRGLSGAGGVGTFGGSEDHTAILCSRAHQIVQYSFCPVQLERSVELTDEVTFVIAHSGVVADKTGAAKQSYNRASRSAQAMLQIWREYSGQATPQAGTTLGAVLRANPTAAADIRRAISAARHSEFSSEFLTKRFEQFRLESEHLVPSAAESLAAADLQRFGLLVDESQRAAEEGLQNQVPETMALARGARRLGAIAASAFGAGFGGSVWALVDHSNAERFCNGWRDLYISEFPDHAQESKFFLSRAGPPLVRLR